MAQDNSWGSYVRSLAVGAVGPGGGGGGGGGGKREKFAGYLKAANEMRQNYYAGYNARIAEIDSNNNNNNSNNNKNAEQSGSWPEVEVTRSEDEELVLFPSYARYRPPNTQGKEGEEGIEEDGNVVDAEVRGWLYAPNSGPLSRKNRYLHWLALKMCGLPAVASVAPGEPGRLPTAAEAEAVNGTAVEIESARVRPASLYSTEGLTRTLSWRTGTNTSTGTGTTAPVMDPAEVASAHAALAARLAPFMHRPTPNARITVTFSDSAALNSASFTVLTSESGYFSLSASLPFAPDTVLVSASDRLSIKEPVKVHGAVGVSVISDIDDTIKHSAITLGTREMCRNTFTEPLENLIIPGVPGWYSRLAGEPYNVSFHYISNSPWQLYPLLKSFFSSCGLPVGSVHLKEYSGVLQGIFEPVADRKKGTVERVIRDFPERKWILIGDSGEADLEVYTEIVERFPDRVLAVFIRDVTTPVVQEGKEFFDPNGNPEYEKAMKEWAEEKAAAVKKTPPPVPPKRRSVASVPAEEEEPLISFDEVPEKAKTPSPVSPKRRSIVMARTEENTTGTEARIPPPRPPKPPSLQHMATAPSSIPTSAPTPPQKASSTPDLICPTSTPHPQPPPPRRTATFSTAPEGVLPSPRPTSMFGAQGLGLGVGGVGAGSQQQLLSKREELWNRRWERALMMLGRHEVQLHAWRTGGDVEAMCRAIVEKALWG